MAKRDPVKALTDEILLSELLGSDKLADNERTAIRAMLEDVRRVRPMTRTRVRLNSKQRAIVEDRYRSLGLREGLEDRNAKRAQTEKAKGPPPPPVPVHMLHPARPPRKQLPSPKPGVEFVDRNGAGYMTIRAVVDPEGNITCTDAAEKFVTYQRSYWTHENVQVLK